MTSLTLNLRTNPQDQQVPMEDVTNICQNTKVENNSKCAKNSQCFVCDVKIDGRQYALATCKTQTSRSKVIEKLGELVGERYMVVISEDDVICRSCANLINTLDKLETEMFNVRNNVLRFLEQKYSLQEGELLGTVEKPKRQPPQITKSNDQSTDIDQKKESKYSMQSTDKGKTRRNNTWMQCDKCWYTTHHSSFMAHHMKDHIKRRIICNKCGAQIISSQFKSHTCILKEVPKDFVESNKDNIVNINSLERAMEQNVPLISVNTYSEPQTSFQNKNIPLIRLSNTENLHLQSILATGNNSNVNQAVYVQVLQPIEVHGEATHPAIITTQSATFDSSVKVKEDSGKQILTLTEDGNLEMVEVPCWNDVQTSELHANITFQ